MKAPRPAMISARPSEIRSRVANCSKSRTGSWVESTVTAVPSRRLVVSLAMAASTISGADRAKSRR